MTTESTRETGVSTLAALLQCTSAPFPVGRGHGTAHYEIGDRRTYSHAMLERAHRQPQLVARGQQGTRAARDLVPRSVGFAGTPPQLARVEQGLYSAGFR